MKLKTLLNQFTLKVCSLILILFSGFTIAHAQTATVSATGAAGSYTTGSATYGGGTVIPTPPPTRTEGTMKVTQLNGNSSAAYAVFNMANASIPAGATITSATVTIVTTAFSFVNSTPANYVYGTTTDLSTVTDPATLYADCINGELISTTSWGTTSGTHVLTLNTAGLAFIQGNTAGTISLGFASTGANFIQWAIQNETSASAPLLTITYTAPVACAGAPAPGAVIASNTTGCSPYLSSMYLSGASIGSGITYQWQSSPDNSTWTDVPGATTSFYAASVSSSVYYRCAVTCANTTSTAYTQGVLLSYTAAATVPWTDGFETITTNNQLPDCWDTTTIGYHTRTYTAAPGGSYNQVPHSGNAFASFSDAATNDFFFTPGFALSAGTTYQFSFWYITDGNGGGDANDGFGTYNAYMFYGTNQSTGSMTNLFDSIINFNNTTYQQFTGIFTPATSGEYYIGINARNVYGDQAFWWSFDDAALIALPPCTGAPEVGVVSPASVALTQCSNPSQMFTLSGITPAAGLAYQWQINTGSGFTPVPGATNAVYTAVITAASTSVNCIVTCTVSGLSTTSATATVTNAPPPYLAVTIATPYTQGFENTWVSKCDVDDVPDTYWLNKPATGDDSWRRDDDGASANWNDPTGGGQYTPTGSDANGASSLHSASFNSFDAPIGTTGAFDLYLDLSAAGSKRVSYDYINPAGTDSLAVLISTNGPAGPFTQLDNVITSTGWTTRSFTDTTTSATCVLRFLATSDFGYDNIGIDNVSVQVLANCTGTPVAGTLTASPAAGCSDFTSNLFVANALTQPGGIAYQWQSSTDGITYTSIAGATGAGYTANVSANTFYRCYLVCTNSNAADTSVPKLLTVGPELVSTATLPYFQGFETWTGTCYPYDRPDTNFIQNPNYGDGAWSREDLEAAAGWDDPGINGGLYFPSSTQGLHSAAYDSYDQDDIDNGTEGDMDLHVNLSASGTKILTFDYNNDDGDDYINVELSEDGGNNFTILGTYNSGDYTGITGWSSQSITFSSVAPNAVIRFAGIGDAGFTNIGIDSLNIIDSVSCDTVTDLTAIGITQTGATVNWTTINGTAGYEVVVNTSSADPTGSGTGVTAATYSATGLTAGTVYYAHVRDSCGPGDFSAWTTITFTTSTACDIVTGLSATGITQNSAAITWNTVAGTEGYEYVVSTSPATPATGTSTVNHAYTATGLSANTTYYVFVRDSCGPGNFSAWDTLSFITLHNTGIATVNGGFDVSAYPNPATDIVTVKTSGLTGDNRKVSLTDITGRVISTVDMPTDRIDFHMSNLAPGIYLVRYEDDAHTRIIKVNKQ